MSHVTKWAAALVLCAFSLAFVACGDSSSGNDAGSSGTAGSTGGGTGAGGAGGTNATGGRGGGAAGRGGGGGTAGGSGANCQMCVACVQQMCASQVATCMGIAACNTIWQCATACTMTVNQCIQMNPAGAAMFAPFALCANTNCAQNGCPY